MFSAISTKLSEDLHHVKSVIAWQDSLRSQIFAAGTGIGKLQLSKKSVKEMAKVCPGKIEWQLFDHCAAISQIYAIFEHSINRLVEDYVFYLPKHIGPYYDLPEDTQLQYRLGIGQILSKWKPAKSLFSHIREDSIACGLADGLRSMPYTLLGDAFLIDSDNYRTDTINRIFKRFGFENAFASVSSSQEVINFLANLGTHTAESLLNEIVVFRNEAAHGTVSAVSSSKQLTDYATFIELLTLELINLLQSSLVKLGKKLGHTKIVAVVKQNYSNNVVGVESCSNHPINSGDYFYAGNKKFPRLESKACKLELSLKLLSH